MPEAKCIGCNCTESRACVGGCSWSSVDPPVCDRCDSCYPFVTYSDEDGWHVVGPGPFGSARVMMVHVASEVDANREAEALNRAYSLGSRAARKMTAKLAARQIARLQKQLAINNPSTVSVDKSRRRR